MSDRSKVKRATRETEIELGLSVGAGRSTVATGVPFLDHMVTTFARYSGLDLDLRASGDLRHHTIEDVAIAIGTAVREITPPTAARYGDRTIPMDDALVHASIDLGGRAFYRGEIPSKLYDHWLRSFAEHAGATLHVRVLDGSDRHHVVEAAFKAVGLALRDALCASDDGAVFSTKGPVSLEVQ